MFVEYARLLTSGGEAPLTFESILGLALILSSCNWIGSSWGTDPCRPLHVRAVNWYFYYFRLGCASIIFKMA